MGFPSFCVLLILAGSLSVSSYTVTDFEQAELVSIVKEEWESFKAEHGKLYDSDVEETYRRKIYINNRHKIAEHNKANSSFKMGMNKFGDMLYHEFNQYNGFTVTPEQKKLVSNSPTFMTPSNVRIPSTVNWVHEGYVTPVKDQKSCGSCWSFGTTGALEGQHFRKTGKLVSLSEQNLVDCIPNGDQRYGCSGCEGGNFFGAFLFIRDEGGIDTEESYPYSAQEQTCRFSPDSVGATDTGYVKIPVSEADLLNAVATVGPIVVAIDVEESFQFYRSGIYYEQNCNSDLEHLNHAVLVVGYGTEDGKDYWLVKNSWSKTWGEDGYIKMSRNKDNNCGIATFAGYPQV